MCLCFIHHYKTNFLVHGSPVQISWPKALICISVASIVSHKLTKQEMSSEKASLHINFLFVHVVDTNVHYANVERRISGFSCEFRLHFAGGKSITARQYTIEMIKLAGRLREDGSHEGVGEIDRDK